MIKQKNKKNRAIQVIHPQCSDSLKMEDQITQTNKKIKILFASI